MAINSISGLDTLSSIAKSKIDTDKSSNDIIGSFSDYLKNAIYNVSNLERDSERLTEEFAAGKADNIHQVMIAAQKSEIALQFTMEIRNKIMDAYQEIMRMQI